MAHNRSLFISKEPLIDSTTIQGLTDGKNQSRRSHSTSGNSRSSSSHPDSTGSALTQAFAERVLAQLHKRELVTDDDVVQILSQDHTGFGFWLGNTFREKESDQFVAR